MALTTLQIKHAKEGMYADSNGLYLRVQKSGAKSWIFRFQLNGKRREMGLGTLTSKSAPDARSEAPSWPRSETALIELKIAKRKLKLPQMRPLKRRQQPQHFGKLPLNISKTIEPAGKTPSMPSSGQTPWNSMPVHIIGDKSVGEITTGYRHSPTPLDHQNRKHPVAYVPVLNSYFRTQRP